MTYFLVIYPDISGITTNRTTERIRVLYGTLISLIPSNKATIGVKAIKMTKSLTATCSTVYAGSPLVR